MANTKISDLPGTTTLTDEDAIAVVQEGITKKFTGVLTALKTLLGIGNPETLQTQSKEVVGAVNELNGKKLLSKNVTIPITDQTIEAGSWLRLVGPGGIYESYDLLTSSEISQGYKVMMVGNGSLRGSGTAINHIIPTFFIFEDTTISQCRLVNTHPTADATPTAILLQVLAYTDGS